MNKIKGLPIPKAPKMGGLATGTNTVVKKVGTVLSKQVVNKPNVNVIPGASRAGKSPSSIGSGGGKSFWSKHSVSGDGMAKASKFPIAKTGSVKPASSGPFVVGKDYSNVASPNKSKTTTKTGERIKQQ